MLAHPHLHNAAYIQFTEKGHHNAQQTDAVKPEDPGVAPSLYHGVSTMQLFGSTYGLQARCLFMHKCFVSWDTLALVSRALLKTKCHHWRGIQAVHSAHANPQEGFLSATLTAADRGGLHCNVSYQHGSK